ncbi:hypothetical protein CTEN210_05623 [Chaetoceros tenuissimus]|uniref:Kinesin light chain n=1 Tax=Chaetoceros tenuissimus TaxID=426638 RepID=A0AAD3CNI8_9STRA|nr:hypothetical protein CTEN210_05623 [Chaetoceros tenuissimus]
MNCLQLNNEACVLIRSSLNDSARERLSLALFETCSKPTTSAAPQHMSLDSSFSSSAESTSSLEHEYDEGMRTFSEPIHISCTQSYALPDAATLRCTVLFNLGLVHSFLSENEEAITYFSDCLEALENLSLSQACRPSAVAVLNNLGHAYFRLGKHGEAVKYYERSIAVARSQYNYCHLDIAAALNSIGVARLYSLSHDSETTFKTLQYFLEANSIRTAVLGDGNDHDRETATVINNIGRVKFIAKEYSEAIKYYKASYEIRMKLLGARHIDVAATLNNMAQAHHKLDLNDTAKDLYKEYIEIASNVFGTSHNDVATAIRCLAEVHEDDEEFEEAIHFYTKSIKSFSSIQKVSSSEKNHVEVEVAHTLHRLCNVYYKMGDEEAALACCEKCYEFETQIPNYPQNNLVNTALNAAHINQNLGDTSNALHYYTEACKIQRAMGPSEETKLASTLSHMGHIFDKCGEYSAAMKAYEEALLLRVNAQGSSHFEVSSTLNAMGMVCYKTQSYEVALKCFEESLSIRKKSEQARTRDITTILFNLGSVHMDTGNSLQALQCFQECYNIEKGSEDTKITNLVGTLKQLGRTYMARSEGKPAVECFKEGVELCKLNENKAVAKELPSFLKMLGNAYLILGDMEKAMNAFCESMRNGEEHSGQEGDQELPLDFYLLSKVDFKQCAPAA